MIRAERLRKGDIIYVRAPKGVQRYGLVEGKVYQCEVIETPAEHGCMVPAFKVNEIETMWYCLLHHPIGDCGLDGEDWIDATEEEYLAQQEEQSA